MDALTAEVREKVAILAGGIGGLPSPPDQMQVATAYMLEFQTRMEAWAVSQQLLNDPETRIQFFAAQLLYGKAKRESSLFDAAKREELRNLLWVALWSRPETTDIAVVKRLALAFVAVLVLTPNGVEWCCTEVEKSLKSQFLPEEIESSDLSRRRSEASGEELLQQCSRIIFIIRELFALEGFQTVDLQVAFLEVLARWSKCGATAELMLSLAPELLKKICLLIVVDSPAVTRPAQLVAAGCSTLEALLNSSSGLIDARAVKTSPSQTQKIHEMDSVAVSSPASRQREQEGYQAFLRSLIQCICQGEWILGVPASPYRLPLLRLATAVGCKELRWILQQWNVFKEAQALVQWLLKACGGACRREAAVVLEFWLDLQSERMVDRPAELGRPLFNNVLIVLLKQCQFPDPPPAEGTEQYEDLCHFRTGNQSAEDVFLNVYYVLDCEYILVLQQFLLLSPGPQPWNTAEVVTFALTAVSREISNLLKRKTPSVRDDVKSSIQQTDQALQKILWKLATTPEWRHPLMCVTFSRLVCGLRQYLGALSHTNKDLLAAIATFLEQSLVHEFSREKAAETLWQLAGVTADALVPGEVEKLLAINQIGLSQRWNVTHRSYVAQALCRLISSMPYGDAFLPLKSLFDMIFKSIAAPTNVESITEDMKVLAVSIRLCEFRGVPSGQHPLERLLMTVLQSASAVVAHKGLTKSYQAISEVLSGCVSALQERIFPHLEGICNMLLAIATAFPHVECLQCAQLMVEVFGKTAEATGFLAAILSTFTPLMVQALQAVYDPDILKGTFHLMQRYLVFLPSVLYQEVILGNVITFSIRWISVQETEPGRAVTSFVSKLLQTGFGGKVEYKNILSRLLGQFGPQLISAVMSGIGGGSPVAVLPILAEVLWELLCGVPDQVSLWRCIEESMSSPSYGGLVSHGTPEEIQRAGMIKARIVAAMKKMHSGAVRMPSALRRFKALTRDVGRLFRGQDTIDMLVAYEME